MDELLVKLKTKYPDLTLSRVHLGRVVRNINITLKQTRLRHVPKTRYKKPIVIKNQIKEFYNKVKQYKLDDYYIFENDILFIIKKVNDYNYQYHNDRGTDNNLNYDNEYNIIKKYFNLNLMSYEKIISNYSKIHSN
jgi:hypothetical protein